MEDEMTSPLCCCEYYNYNSERSHLLGFCCNCTDLDEGFDSLITGKGFPEHNRTGLMAVLQDRMRIPWRGGAKQIAFDAVLPIIILPAMFFLASISLWWTVFSFTAVLVIVMSIFGFLMRTIPRTKFFIVWTITSIVILYVIFELIVIPFLEIVIEENIALSVFIALFLFFLYMMKVRNTQLLKLGDGEAESGFVGASFTRCRFCQLLVPDKDHHCIWFDCCVGQHNRCLFLLTLLFAVIALVYSSNLTLTSVCHPFSFYKSILMPDDCSDVYEQFELGLSFVSALYSLALAFMLLVLLLHQILLISLGISSKEWRKFSCLSKCGLGLCSRRPNSRGFVKNWGRILCERQDFYSNSHQID